MILYPFNSPIKLIFHKASCSLTHFGYFKADFGITKASRGKCLIMQCYSTSQSPLLPFQLCWISLCHLSPWTSCRAPRASSAALQCVSAGWAQRDAGCTEEMQKPSWRAPPPSFVPQQLLLALLHPIPSANTLRPWEH